MLRAAEQLRTHKKKDRDMIEAYYHTDPALNLFS